jgi:RNA polymerase sigma-70 factor (ECF subfamily)
MGEPAGTTMYEETTQSASSFAVFFEEHHMRLFGTLCIVSGDRVEAEDLMQETFLKVWEKWEHVSLLEDPAAYAYRTAFNLFRSHLRRAVLAAKRTFHAGDQPDAFEVLDDREALIQALRQLSPRQRAAIVLTDLLDFTSEEAAQTLGIKAVTVRVLASQARAALRKAIGRGKR